MSQKVLPCPCCGSDVKYVYVPGDYGYTRSSHEIRCPSCKLSMWRGNKEEFDKKVGMWVEVPMKDNLIESWNKRVSNES